MIEIIINNYIVTAIGSLWRDFVDCNWTFSLYLPRFSCWKQVFVLLDVNKHKNALEMLIAADFWLENRIFCMKANNLMFLFKSKFCKKYEAVIKKIFAKLKKKFKKSKTTED